VGCIFELCPASAHHHLPSTFSVFAFLSRALCGDRWSAILSLIATMPFNCSITVVYAPLVALRLHADGFEPRRSQAFVYSPIVKRFGYRSVIWNSIIVYAVTATFTPFITRHDAGAVVAHSAAANLLHHCHSSLLVPCLKPFVISTSYYPHVVYCRNHSSIQVVFGCNVLVSKYAIPCRSMACSVLRR